MIVAERPIEFYGDDGVGVGFVRVYAPYKDERVIDWACRFVMSWPGYEQGHVVFGEDSWGALFSTFVAVPQRIAKTPDFIAGRLGMLGKKLTTIEQLKEQLSVWKSKPW
jgi:hypothetical protein